MLDTLQQQLSDVYRLGQGPDIRNFLVTDPLMAKALGQGSVLTDSEETLLVSQDGGELSLSLFLDAELLQRVESGNPFDKLRADMLDDLWKVLEGVSHFLCVVWKAERDRTVSLLELELQGEIDKYIIAMLLAMNQSDVSLARSLHRCLFDRVRFHDDLDEVQRARYRSANDYAARFCHDMKQSLIAGSAATFEKLRIFYRMQLGDKISYINRGRTAII